MTHQQDDHAPTTVGGFAARAAGALVVDALLNGAVLLSVITLVAGVLTRSVPWVTLGVTVGLAGAVIPWWAMAAKWRDRRAVGVASGVIVVEIATMTLLWLCA